MRFLGRLADSEITETLAHSLRPVIADLLHVAPLEQTAPQGLGPGALVYGGHEVRRRAYCTRRRYMCDAVLLLLMSLLSLFLQDVVAEAVPEGGDDGGDGDPVPRDADAAVPDADFEEVDGDARSK